MGIVGAIGFVTIALDYEEVYPLPVAVFIVLCILRMYVFVVFHVCRLRWFYQLWSRAFEGVLGVL